MASKDKKELDVSEKLFAEEVFDIIELTSNDIDLLADAFDLIATVCDSVDNPHVVIEEDYSSEWVH